MKTRTASWDYQRRYSAVPEPSPFASRYEIEVDKMIAINPDWEKWYDAAPGKTCGEMLPLMIEHNLLIAAAARIVAERELEIFGDNPEGMETPYQIRASLGI